MFLYSLLALAVVTALIFAAPLKAKVWATLAVVAAGALWASATAVGVLAGGPYGCGRPTSSSSEATQARWTLFRRCSR